MPACPAGHESTAADFCDVCGIRIEGASTPSGVTPGPAAGGGAGPAGQPGVPAPGVPAPGGQCPQCGTERSGQFCEVCGFDFQSGRAARPVSPGPTAPVSAAPAQPATESGRSGWTAVVTADRAYFDRVVAAGGPDASALEFPAYCPERRFGLSGKEARIGRRSASRGLDPEIDLTGPPTDPGVSHLHAVLVSQPGGGWSVLDPGSSNGTQVNGADIGTGEAVPLHPGDRINIGAWTLLTIDVEP